MSGLAPRTKSQDAVNTDPLLFLTLSSSLPQEFLQGEQSPFQKYISSRIPYVSKCLYKHCFLLGSNKNFYCWKQLRRSDLAFHPPESTAKLSSPDESAKQTVKLNFTLAFNLLTEISTSQGWHHEAQLSFLNHFAFSSFPAHQCRKRNYQISLFLTNGKRGQQSPNPSFALCYPADVVGRCWHVGTAAPHKGHLNSSPIAGFRPPSIKRVYSRCITDTHNFVKASLTSSK